MTPQNRPSALRSTLSRLAIAGTASLAAVFVVAPVAVADEATSSDPSEGPASAATSAQTDADEGTESSETPAEEIPEDGAETPSEPDTDATGTEAAPTEASDAEADKPVVKAAIEDEIEGDFGFQKFRVGVQIADGSFVPEGATTVGSKFQITYTDQDGGKFVETCVTEADSDDEETTSFCVPDDGPDEEFLRGLPSKVAAAVAVGPDDDYVEEQYFYAEPGETVTIKQLGAGPGLVKSSDVATIEPCRSNDSFLGVEGPCGTGTFPFGFDPTITKVLFDNAAAGPKANPDTAKTTPGKAVTIDVLKNDNTQGQQTTDLSVADEPANGEAEVLGAPADPASRATGAGDLKIRYTPKAGFSGKDTFRYTLSTASDSSTTTVTITVQDGATAAVASSTTPTAATKTSNTLPDTGGSSVELLGLAALMLAGGGALTVRARRRIGVDVD